MLVMPFALEARKTVAVHRCSMSLTKVAAFALALGVVWKLFFSTAPVPDRLVKGGCSKQFQPVEKAYRKIFADGLDRGGAFFLYHKGEIVCDMWGGYQDERNLYPWQEDTISTFFSATKAMCALCMIILSDRGLIDFQQPVTKYWPEFGQNGKEDITVQQLLSHQAGLVAIDEDISFEMIRNDVEAVGKALAKQTPNWKPGSKFGYHLLTIGLYIEQLVMRVDPKHRRLDIFFREEVGEPFDIDFHIGIPLEYQYRVASTLETTFPSLLYQCFVNDWGLFKFFIKGMFVEDPITARGSRNPSVNKEIFDVKQYNWPLARATQQGAANGHGTARAVAKLFGILTNGGSHNGKVLLSEKSLHLLDEAVVSGTDRILNLKAIWGNAIMVFRKEGSSQIFGHIGYGGQLALGNKENQLGLGFHSTTLVMTFYDTDPRFKLLKNAISESIPSFKP